MKQVHRTHSLLVFCLVSSVFSYALFLKCYFPIKQGLSGLARVEDAPSEPVTGRTGVPPAVYQRLVLMVVDALRTDFVLGDIPFMPFTRRLLQDGRGVAFSARTHLPTVTLPRIKAMVSGSIPGFVDVVLNFGSSALTEDNLLTQLMRAGKTMTFFGDDTWLRLFPDHFARADGTSSFFVTDYTEVDVNVSRHLAGELGGGQGGWEVMVLHYLGLDHLGHLYAPHPTLFSPKLREMDDVVRQIFTAMASWEGGEQSPALLVLTGDHGVSDQGGHGGASPEETGVPLVLLSPHTAFHTTHSEILQVDQIDLCPTLSALLGLPIPLNNLGQVQVTALPSDTLLQDQVRHLQLNAAQMLRVLEQNVGTLDNDPAYHLYQDAVRAHTSWLSSRNSSTTASWDALGSRVLIGYQDAVQRMSQRIGQTSTRYDMHGITVAILCLWLNLLIQGLLLISNHCAASPLRLPTLGSSLVLFPIILVAMLTHVTMCTSQHRSDILCGISVVSVVVQVTVAVCVLASLALGARLMFAAWADFVQRGRKAWSVGEMALAGCPAVHSFSLLSSSYVEEEHQTWYFFVSTFHCLLLLLSLAQLAVSVVIFPARSKIASKALHGEGEHSVGARSDNSDSGCRFSEEKENSCLGAGRAAVQAVSVAAILVLCRVQRRWNQTGNKWLDEPDVGDWLVRPENRAALSLLVVVSLTVMVLTRLGSGADRMKRWLMTAALLCIYLSKAATGVLVLPGVVSTWLSSQGVVEARLAYLFIVCLTVLCLKGPQSTAAASQNTSGSASANLTGRTFPLHQQVSKSPLHDQNYHSCHLPYSSIQDTHEILPALERHKGLWEGVQGAWLCVMCLLLRPHNVVQVMMVSVVERLAGSYVLPAAPLRPWCILLYCLMMGQATFFFQGNSNSLSTVDVSAGMTALSDYQPVLIGIQIAMATYAGIIFWLLSSFKYLAISPAAFHCSQLSEAYNSLCSAALWTRALSIAVYSMLVTAMRYHLFVWTVFSPKLLYEGCLTLVLGPFCVGALLLARRAARSSTTKLKL